MSKKAMTTVFKLQHKISSSGKAAAKTSCDPGYGETFEAVATSPSSQPLPNQGREGSTGGRLKYDVSTGKNRNYEGCS